MRSVRAVLSAHPCRRLRNQVALGPGDEHPIFDYCDANSVMAAADAFMEVGLYEAGYRHLHLDDCWAAKERNATGYPYPEKDHFPDG